LAPFFSTKAVIALEPVVKAKVDILVQRFENARKTGQVIRVDVAFMALTMDVICQYAFANDDNILSKDDFNLALKETIQGGFESGALLRQFPSMLPILNALPDTLLGFMMPSMILMLNWKAGVRRRVTPILNRTESVSDVENLAHKTILHELRDSSLPESEKTVDRLCDEAQILMGAGSETSAHTLTVTFFYLLQEKRLFLKLKEELKKFPEADNWMKLTQLPYLVTKSSSVR
jgi:cytochrome P450